MNDPELTSDEPPDDPSRSDLVRIRLPSGEHEWVTPEAFNLISEKEFLDSDQLRRLRRQRDMALAVAGLTALVVLAAGLSYVFQGREAAPAAESEASASGVVALPSTEIDSGRVDEPPPSSRAAEPAPPAPAESDEAAAPTSELAEIEETVRSWARAWSAQDAEGYLAYYSAAFRLPEGLDRSAWEALRRQRIENPRRIAVTVSEVEATLAGDGAATARFGQGYRAPGYRDWVLKTLELEREADGWRIVEERSALIEIAGAPREE